MYYALSMFIGFCIAAMVAANGGLTNSYGVYLASVLIHAVGLVAVIIVQLLRREPLRPRQRLPFFYFLGGAVGVATTVFNNLAFGKISISAIVALGLLGQSIASVVIDHFGLFGMPKRNFNKKKLIGLVFLAAGITVMILY